MFYMGNGWGKTLLYTALNKIIAWVDEVFFDKSLSDLRIVISANIDDDLYEFVKTNSTLNIKYNGEEITNNDYKKKLNSKLSITEHFVDIKWDKEEQRNTPSSLFRFMFFSDNDLKIPNKWVIKTIPLINTAYDWFGRKMIFSYFLWTNLLNSQYNDLKSYFSQKNFIEKHRTKYNKYAKFIKWGNSFVDDTADLLYRDYSDTKSKLGDLTVAVNKLEKLIERYKNYKWENKDYSFLVWEKKSLETMRLAGEIKSRELKDKIKKYSAIDKAKLTNQTIKDKDIEIVKRYIKYQEKIAISEKDEELVAIEAIVDKQIIAFKDFFDTKVREYWISDYFPYIHFEPNTLSVIVGSGISQWQAVVLRIVCSVFLSIYANNNTARFMNNIFYDSIVEKIDKDNSLYLMKFFQKIIAKDCAPNIFMFITWARPDVIFDGINVIEKDVLVDRIKLK